MILALGMFVFSVPTLLHEELQRRSEWRFAANARVGARDAFQFVGVGDERMTLSGSAIDSLQDGRASLDDLRTMAGTGQSWPLIDAAGIAFGDFVITTIDEGAKQFGPDGRALRIDFAIDLMRVDDEADA